MSLESVPPGRAAAIRSEVEKLCAEPSLARAEQLVRMLRFTVDETLAGRGHTLKAYTIAVGALGRRSDFDAQSDSVVRVLMKRLRTRLKEYYDVAGRLDPILIEYPAGTYEPQFTFREAIEKSALPPLESRRMRWARPLQIGGLLLAIAVAGFLARVQSPAPPPHIPVQVTFDTGFTSSPSVSRDGRLLAYHSDRAEAGNPDIWVHPLAGGGPPIRLTDHPAHDVNADISPDGSQVVFRSTRDGGGIFIASVRGGTPRRLSDSGHAPRFSPDGARIAYSYRTDSGAAQVRVITTDGRTSVIVRPESGHSMGAVWSPEGDRLAFLSTVDPAERAFDWWIAPVSLQGSELVVGPAVRTGASAILKKNNLGEVNSDRIPGDWYSAGIVLNSPSTGIWVLPIDRLRSAATGLRQILPGPTGIGLRTLAGRGTAQFFFGHEGRLNHVWAVSSFDGVTTRLTNDASLRNGILTRMSVTADGAKLVFPSMRSGAWHIWQTNLTGGEPTRLSDSNEPDDFPVIAADGSRLAFLRRLKDAKPAVFLSENGRLSRVCEDCGDPRSWTRTGKLLTIRDRAVLSVDIATGQPRVLFQQPGWTPLELAASPDGRWLALGMDCGKKQIQGFVAPFTAEQLPDVGAWSPVAEEPYHVPLAWSPDSDRLYFLHAHEGVRCLGMRRIPHRTDMPFGPLEWLRHFHSFQNYPLNGSVLAASRDKVFITLAELRSNIWRVTVP